jgi:hypothetical protein
VRIKRAAAYLVDTGPLWLALLMVAPQCLIIAGLAVAERVLGFGFFDPVRGGDPVLIQAQARALHASLAALVLASLWLLPQVVLLARTRRSLGRHLFGLPAAASGESALMRASFRLGLPYLVPIACLFLARWSLPKLEPRNFYAPMAPAMPLSPLVVLIVVGVLCLGAVGVTLWDAVAVLRRPDARTLGDRLARAPAREG